MLRIILLIILVYYLVRFLSNYVQRAVKPQSKGRAQTPTSSSNKVIDEMTPCAFCRTFLPTRLAIEKNKLYFCSEQCHEAYLKKGT
jgi:hypothetical protein